MRLVELLTLILEAHAATLQRLAALLSEEVLFELLEQAGDEDNLNRYQPKPLSLQLIQPSWSSQPSAYAELEAAVTALKLPPQLEFYLWGYPTYRTFIEDSLDLNSTIDPTSLDFVEETIGQARSWIHSLPLPPDLGRKAEFIAEVPWRKFRTTVLKAIGRRPLERVR